MNSLPTSSPTFNPGAGVPPAPPLEELAADINREHEQAETELRAGLGHARRAGDLLLLAKEQVGHGRWLDWLAAKVKASPRTCQAYMRVARSWPELEAKCATVAHLTYRQALATLAEPLPDGNDDGTPAALACLHAEGWLCADCLDLLMALKDDFGPEPMTHLETLPTDLSVAEAFDVLNQLRPLDHPPWWPMRLTDESPQGRSVIGAVRVFCEETNLRKGAMPSWELAAFWFGCHAVLVSAIPGLPSSLPVLLSRALDVWRESFRAALMWVITMGPGDCPDAEDKRDDWWGYRSDLRHAGVLEQAEQMRDGSDGFPCLRESHLAGLDRAIREMSYALPSNRQGRLQRLGGGQ
jgi:hypothetical protein